MLAGTLFGSHHKEMALQELGKFPDMEAAFLAWQALDEDDEAFQLDPLSVPAALWPTTMLVELDPGFTDATLRLAGTLVCRLHGGEMKGKSVRTFFEEHEAEKVIASMRTVIETGRPSLARRSYIALDGDHWDYTRLLLPQRGRSGTFQIFKVMDPSTLRKVSSIQTTRAAEPKN